MATPNTIPSPTPQADDFIAKYAYSRYRLEGLVEAINILNVKRKECAHDATQAWDKLYSASDFLLKQMSLKEAA